MLLENKKAVVYGGSGSVGRAVAHAFAREGATLFLAGRTPVTLEGVADEIRSAGGTAETAQLDALDEQAVDKFVDGVKTPINGSINFSLGTMTRFYAFNIENLAPCNCSLSDIVIYDTSRPDQEIANLAAGTHPAVITMVRELIVERMDPAMPRRFLGTRGPAHDTCPPDCCLRAG